ncbi:MAG: hypothetical protein MH204_02700, partial [Fimbriimonadaceae bacterium]|nr:hypothetical protein [Fimbriimonadaceae bacterium]
EVLDVEFVGDRALLDSAGDYIVVEAPGFLSYSLNHRLLSASGPEHSVKVRYRDILVESSNIQLNVPTYEVRARDARVTIAGRTVEVQQLAFRLNQRRGVGFGPFETEGIRWTRLGSMPVPVKQTRRLLTYLEVSSNGLRPVTGISRERFNWWEAENALSVVEADKAVVFPAREIYFYRSNIKVSGVSVMKMPLLQVSASTSTPILTDQFFNVSGNQLNINYPYYLELEPGMASLFRFRYGNRFSSGVGGSGGFRLDYELNWNQGAEQSGAAILSGMNRSDWGVSLRQFIRPDRDSSLAMQLDFPAHRSVFSNVSYSKGFSGYQFQATGLYGRGLTSENAFTQENYQLSLERDPISVPSLNAGLHLGVNATSSRFSGASNLSRSGYGWQARLVGRPMRLDASNTIHYSYRFDQLLGRSAGRNSISQYGSLALSTSISNGFGLFTTYDFQDDSFNSRLLGRHRITSEAFWTSPSLTLRGSFSRALDMDRFAASGGAQLTVSPLWRMYYNTTIDRYLDGSYFDQTLILGYRLGFREVGLSWSQQTGRIGLEILGTSW